MKRIVPRTLLATAAVATLGLLGPTGCADNRSTLYVVGVLAVPSSCEVTYASGQRMIGSGRLDTLFASTYFAALLIGNQMVPQGNNNQLRAETSRVQLLGAEVNLSRVGGGQVASFTTASSGTVDPVPSQNPGFGGTDVMLIPAGLDPEPGEYHATIRVFGRTLGGEDVETGDFVFPIVVCEGCSVSGVDADNECQPLGPSASPSNSCFIGQDGATHCSVCVGSHPACGVEPAVPAGP